MSRTFFTKLFQQQKPDGDEPEELPRTDSWMQKKKRIFIPHFFRLVSRS